MNRRYVHLLSVDYIQMVVWRGAVTPIPTKVRSSASHNLRSIHGQVSPWERRCPYSL